MQINCKEIHIVKEKHRLDEKLKKYFTSENAWISGYKFQGGP
jgi:hypothetical protein